MKKILTTLTVIAAAALGAQGQTTIEFPAGGSGTFTNLTFDPDPSTAVLDPFAEARLLFRSTNLPSGVTISLSGITLTGQGLSSPLSFSDVLITNTSNTFTVYRDLNSSVTTWQPSTNRLSFNIQINNGSLAFGSKITYGLTYSDADNVTAVTRIGDVNLVAVPEPSAYAAAAGLLALFLWSSRRHLFKLAGTRSAAASSQGENGAA
jgi:hypothetical protein